MPLFGNWQSASRAGQTDTADFAADLLNSVEPYGILVTAGDNDTFPLWYAQEVQGIRKDVIVACLSLLFELGLGYAAADHPIVSTRCIGTPVLPNAVRKRELFCRRGCR